MHENAFLLYREYNDDGYGIYGQWCAGFIFEGMYICNYNLNRKSVNRYFTMTFYNINTVCLVFKLYKVDPISEDFILKIDH